MPGPSASGRDEDGYIIRYIDGQRVVEITLGSHKGEFIPWPQFIRNPDKWLGKKGGGDGGGGDDGGGVLTDEQIAAALAGGDDAGATGGTSGTTTGGTAEAAEPIDPVITQAQSIYFDYYGEQAPKNMIEEMRDKQGMNLWEIAWELRHRPAYARTPHYQQQWDGYVGMLAQAFGRR